jgi:hypothetical protein
MLYNSFFRSLVITLGAPAGLRNNIYIPFLLCLTSLSLPDMIGQFSKNPGK